MRRIVYILLVVMFMGMTAVNAAVYKGQRAYIKKCRVCHHGGEKIAQSRTMKKWRKLFKKKGAKLAAIHIKSQRVADQLLSLHERKKAKKWTVKKVNKYFKSKKFKKYSRHLRDFFVEYAKDSGNVPACN